MTNNNKLLSFIRRHRTIFFSTASLALTAALTTLAVTTGLVTAAVPTDDYSAAEPALSATATDTAEPYSGADSTLYGSVNLSPALPDTPRTTVSTEGATARLDATAPDLEYGGGSLQYLAAAEPEGDYFAVTFKTHGYSGTQDYPTKIYFGGYSYDDNAGNGEANTHYTMADGDVLTRYILKTQYYRSYDLKAYCPFATIESYKVYATDDPSIVYTDEESDEYKSFIERAKWSSNAYLSFRNTDKVNITIEVTYGKSFNNVYFSTPTPINTYTGTASGMILGCFIRGNSTYNSYTSVSFNDSEFISVQKGGELRLRTNNNYYLIKNLKAYKRSADGVKGEEIPLTLTTEKTSYNSIEEYTFTMPEDSDIIFECDALYYRTYLNVNSDGKLFLNPSDSAPTIISTNGGDPEKSTRLSFAQYISAGYEYKITYNDRLNRSKLTRGVLSYTDLDGNAQEEAFEAVDGTITFTMPFVMNPTTSNQTVLTLYCDDSNLKNLDIVTDTVYKGRIKLSDAQGEYSISIYANRGTKGFNANTYNSFNYSLSDNSYTNYDLCAGRKYTVEDIYSYYQGKRLVYNGIEIFKKDADGNVTDEKVEVTDNGDGTYSFVMPECDIQLKPLYYDKLHCFTVENNQSGFGSSTIAPTDSSDGQSYLFDSNGLSVNNSTRKSITVNSYGIRTYTYILEDGTYTLSHQLTNDTAYRVKSVKAYKPYINSSGTQNCYIVTKDNVIQNEPYEDELQAQIITDNGDGTYTIKVPDSFSEKQNAVIYTELEYFTENYTDINYTVSQNCFYAAPPTALEGYFQDNTGKRSKTFSSNSETNATLSTLKNQDIDFSLNRGGYQAVYTPLTVTVTNAETGEVVARVEYLNEEYEFVEGVEDEFLSAPVTTYSNNGDGTKTKNNIKFTMHFADYPINLAVETSEAYAPLIINQYKVDAQGNASPVSESDGFTTKIQAAIHGGYSNVSAERLPQLHSKFFTEDGSAYNQSFDVNGASYSCKYIVPVNIDTGRVAVSAIPKAADGYMLSGIDAVALDRFGTVVTSNSAYWYEPTKAGVWYTTAYTTYGTDGNSYLCTTGYRSGYHNPSEQLVINVYYAEKASLTVNQIIEGFVNEASWTELANVKVEDYIEPRENTKPFLSDDKGVIDTLTYSISGRTAHTKEDELNIWSNTCGVTPGTGVKLTVTPKGAKKIQSFAAYTMNNGERTDILHTLVSGTGFPGTETVYLLDDEVSAGDDIFVDITYEEAQTLKLDVRM
ncbi:MAG: hypothetical protein ACI4RP_09625, partial [Acutalibacteraceae bacterium]